MDWLYDDRTECHSVLGRMTIGEYLGLAEAAHAQRGGINGQRDVLKTTTAKRIRERMISDIRAGAVLPPVVIGVVIDAAANSEIEAKKWDEMSAFLAGISKYELTIIDGMQRTAALFEACEIDASVRAAEMRIEFWVAKSVRSLVYRMLVLNTGQVPWTLARQLTVVYEPLLKEIKAKVSNIDQVFTPDKPGRRTVSGQFSSDALVELYMAFSLRKASVDTKETLSEEFSRLDFVENLADTAFQEYFYTTLSMLIELDKAFGKYSNGGGGRFTRGKEVFGSQPARIGFMVAVAQHVLGRPALDREHKDRVARMETVKHQVKNLVAKLMALDVDDVGQFLKLDVLSEVLDKRVGQVGRYERAVFFEAFKVLIDENFDVPNLEPCWRA